MNRRDLPLWKSETSTFCCKCGSKHYELFKGATIPYANKFPEVLDMTAADVYWSATCEGCKKRWGNYKTIQILEEVLRDDGALK
jgi:predicted nucleic-acid-binding Zn-ribbon protein